MILKIKIGIIFFISIDFLQLSAQNAKPPDALSSLFGDLLKSAGNLPSSPSSVTKEPSLLHNLVRNVEKQKSEKSNSDQPQGFPDFEKDGEKSPSSGTKPSKDGFKPSKDGEGFDDDEEEERDRERGSSSGNKNKNTKPGEKDFDFTSNSGLKPVRPPPSIELNEDYGDEEYSDEEEENDDDRLLASSSEVFDRPKPVLPVAVIPKARNNSTKKRKLKPKLKQWCPRNTNCDDDDGKQNWINFRDSSPSKLCSEAGRETTETCIYQRLRPGGRSSLKCGVCRTVFIPRIVGGVDIKSIEKTDKKKQPKPEKLREVGTVSKSKLEWVEVDSSVENCDGEMSSSSRETKTVSPSILCENTGASQELRCLCAKKDEKVKHICGECKISLKLK